LIVGSLTGLPNLTHVSGQNVQQNYVVEYHVPTPNSAPLAITVDGAGNVWFTESNASKLGMFNPLNQTFREYKVPWVGDMWGIIVDQSESVWFTLSSGKGSVSPGGAIVPGGFGSIVRFNPLTGNFTRIPIPTLSAFPLRLQMDPQGRVWFTELLGNKIGVYDASLNSLKEYRCPTNMSGPADLTFDAKGNLWFTEAYASQLGEFNPTLQSFVEYPLGGNASSDMISSPVGIAIDAKGIVWVADHGGNWIVRFDPQTKTTTKFPTHIPPSDVYPISLVNDILLDKEGRVWFAEHGGNSIGYFVPGTSSMVEFPIPTGPISTALWLALAPSGDVWFAEWSGNNIGTIRSNSSAPITVTTPTSSLVVNQGDQFTIPLQIAGIQRFADNGTTLFSWSSYTPTDASAVFTPSNFTLSATQVSVEAQFTISKNTDPGNYTLALGVETKSVRVLTMVSVEVLKYNQPGLPVQLTSEIVLLVLGVTVALALFLRRLSKRSHPV